MATLYTIGYGNEEKESVFTLIGTKVLVDVRSKPYSRWRPQFNMPALRSRFLDRYHGMPELGGLGDADPKDRQQGLEKVRALLESGRDVVLLCAEKDPNKCHRKPLAEEISAGKWEVIHLVVPAKKSALPELFLLMLR